MHTDYKSMSLHDRITLGVKRGVAKALQEHKLHNRSICIWKDDKVVDILPEDIPEIDNTLWDNHV